MTGERPSLAYEPWFEDVLLRAHLARGSRVLQLTAQSPGQTRAILARIGAIGTLTVVEPDRYRASVVDSLEHPGLSVLAYEPEGGEIFGIHDTVIACPRVAVPSWPMNRWGELAVHNLRPGGRFVFDLPGERHCDLIAECWREIRAAPERLALWNGPSESALAKLLRADGLREVTPTVATHLVHFDGAPEVARWVGELLEADDDTVASLQLALTRRLATHAASDLLFRRSRIHGMH